MPTTETVGLSIEREGDIVAMIGMALNAESGRKRVFSAADNASFACSVKVVAEKRKHRELSPIRIAC